MGGGVPRSSPVDMTLCLGDHAQSRVHASVASGLGKESLPLLLSIRGGREGGCPLGHHSTVGLGRQTCAREMRSLPL